MYQNATLPLPEVMPETLAKPSVIEECQGNPFIALNVVWNRRNAKLKMTVALLKFGLLEK